MDVQGAANKCKPREEASEGELCHQQEEYTLARAPLDELLWSFHVSDCRLKLRALIGCI